MTGLGGEIPDQESNSAYFSSRSSRLEPKKNRKKKIITPGIYRVKSILQPYNRLNRCSSAKRPNTFLGVTTVTLGATEFADRVEKGATAIVHRRRIEFAPGAGRVSEGKKYLWCRLRQLTRRAPRMGGRGKAKQGGIEGREEREKVRRGTARQESRRG